MTNPMETDAERALDELDRAWNGGRLSLQHDGGDIDQRFMRVYTSQQGRWQAVAVQVYPVL